jgi:hypothetical protein
MGKKTVLFVSALLAAVPAFAQMPDGSDINQAIPIYFGQVAAGIGDSVTQPHVVYAISLAKGQQMTFAANRTTAGSWQLYVLRPSVATVASAKAADVIANSGTSPSEGKSLDYLVPAAGTYYVVLAFSNTGIGYELTLKSQGPIITLPNPISVGCFLGQVDYITYSAQLVAMELPDEISIGGAVACLTCTVKPPAYFQLTNRIESAMKAQLPVQACYDSNNIIFQVKLMHQ